MTDKAEPSHEPGASVEPRSDIADLHEAAAELVIAEPEDPSDPIDLVRRRLDIEDRVTDVTIAASLAQIATRADPRERWLAAFGSPLGKHLARRGGDLNAALDILLALAPRLNG
ncbi:MAG: hypothetical protein J0H99_01035 [Rhodospirillales bacterium]|nr:hypothetical protein [Rhodospirillales bacterium]